MDAENNQRTDSTSPKKKTRNTRPAFQHPYTVPARRRSANRHDGSDMMENQSTVSSSHTSVHAKNAQENQSTLSSSPTPVHAENATAPDTERRRKARPAFQSVYTVPARRLAPVVPGGNTLENATAPDTERRRKARPAFQSVYTVPARRLAPVVPGGNTLENQSTVSSSHTSVRAKNAQENQSTLSSSPTPVHAENATAPDTERRRKARPAFQSVYTVPARRLAPVVPGGNTLENQSTVSSFHTSVRAKNAQENQSTLSSSPTPVHAENATAPDTERRRKARPAFQLVYTVPARRLAPVVPGGNTLKEEDEEMMEKRSECWELSQPASNILSPQSQTPAPTTMTNYTEEENVQKEEDEEMVEERRECWELSQPSSDIMSPQSQTPAPTTMTNCTEEEKVQKEEDEEMVEERRECWELSQPASDITSPQSQTPAPTTITNCAEEEKVQDDTESFNLDLNVDQPPASNSWLEMMDEEGYTEEVVRAMFQKEDEEKQQCLSRN